MRSSDEELLKRFVEGDREAFSELVRRHEDRVFAVALRMTGNRPDALDASQDAFVTALRQASHFRGDAAFGTWLYRITINCCHDLLRKRARSAVPQEELPEAVSASRVEAEASVRVDISTALGQLSEDYREAVVLHDLGGVPYEEIATLTGVSLGTVKSRISRGRKRLAEILEQPSGAQASKGKT